MPPLWGFLLSVTCASLKRCYTLPMNKPKTKSTIELVEEVTDTVMSSPVIQSDVVVLKESLKDSGRVKIATAVLVIDILLAILPILVSQADPAFVAMVSQLVQHLQTLFVFLGSVLIGARTMRNTGIS